MDNDKRRSRMNDRFTPMNYDKLKETILNGKQTNNPSNNMKDRDPSIKQFVVDRKDGSYDMKHAKEYFMKWHDRLYKTDQIEILRIESKTCYIITYKILDKKTAKSKTLDLWKPNPYQD